MQNSTLHIFCYPFAVDLKNSTVISLLFKKIQNFNLALQFSFNKHDKIYFTEIINNNSRCGSEFLI